MLSDDIDQAAAVLHLTPFFQGKGDRTEFIKALLQGDPKTLPLIAAKLRLICCERYKGLALYRDKNLVAGQLKRQTLFRLWMHLVRRGQVMTTRELADIFPYAREQLETYERFVDVDGKTTLNKEEQRMFR